MCQLIDPMLMIDPPPAFAISGWTACEAKNDDSDLILVFLPSIQELHLPAHDADHLPHYSPGLGQHQNHALFV